MRRLSAGLQFLILLFVLVLGLVLIAFLVLNNSPKETYESPSNENQKVVDITDEIHKDFNDELTIKNNNQKNIKDNSSPTPTTNVVDSSTQTTTDNKNIANNTDIDNNDNVEELDPTSALDRITTEYTGDDKNQNQNKKIIDPVNYDHKSGFDNLF